MQYHGYNIHVIEALQHTLLFEIPCHQVPFQDLLSNWKNVLFTSYRRQQKTLDIGIQEARDIQIDQLSLANLIFCLMVEDFLLIKILKYS